MLPVIYIKATYLPEAWEKAVLSVLYNGVIVPTEYGKNTVDSTLIVEITSPNLLYIHKNIPAGIDDLEKYRQSITWGTEDYLISKGSKDYTYHQRLFRDNQMEYIIDKLSIVPYSRRAQVVTWIPEIDTKTDFCPCLQIMNFRLLYDIVNGVYKLDTNIYWRSRDVYKAWFMNIYAIVSLIERIIFRLKQRTSYPIVIGRIVDICSSGHIYERDISSIYHEISKMETSHWSKRVFLIDDVLDIIKETQTIIGEDEYWEKEPSMLLYNKQVVQLTVEIDRKVNYPELVEIT